MSRNQLKKIKFILPVFVLAFFIFLAPRAKADLLGIGSITNSAIANVVLYFQGLVMGFIGNLLSWVASGLGWFLKFQGGFFQDVAIVKTSWTVFRDFANMFFILILIIIAFATIFDIQNYNWKGLMAKFIIAALLINFSLAIGGFLINLSSTVSNVMLNQLGDISADLAGGFGVTKLATVMSTGGDSAKNVGDPENLVIGSIISFAGMIIVASVTLLSLLAAFVFSIVRVPVLWTLLIVSPLAWITGILPATREFNKKWWDWFIGWTFFLPMYLFTLMMGFVILKNRPDLGAAALLAQQSSGLSGLPARVGNFFGFTFQDIFYWGLTVIILIGGLAASLKASFAAGSGATKVFGTISGGINNWAKRQAYIPAIQKAGKEKLAEIQDTGLQSKFGRFLYGGERAERLKAARVAGILGKKEAMSEAEATEVQKDYAKYKARNLDQAALEQLNNQVGTKQLSKYQELAIRTLRAENGWVAEGKDGEKEMEETVRAAGENSRFSQAYIEVLKKNGFAEALGSQAQAEDLAKRTTILPLKKAILDTMVKNNQILSDTMAKMVLDIFRNDSKSVRDEIEKGLQKNIKNFSDTRTKKDRVAYLLDPTKNKDLRRILAKQMSEDGEVNTYQKYATASELFGGENETKSREMLNKIIRESPVAHAEIEFRKDLALANKKAADPSYKPAPAEMVGLKPKLIEKLKRIDAKKISEVDKEMWNVLQFQEALQEKIDELQVKDPGESVIPRGGTDAKGKVYPKGRNAIPGGGARFKDNLKKLVGGEPEKLFVINSLAVT